MILLQNIKIIIYKINYKTFNIFFWNTKSNFFTNKILYLYIRKYFYFYEEFFQLNTNEL